VNLSFSVNMNDNERDDVAGRDRRYEVLRAQRDEAVSLLQELLDEQVSCDTDNPHVAVWCIMHQAKRCHMDDIVARGRDFLSLLAELGEGP